MKKQDLLVLVRQQLAEAGVRAGDRLVVAVSGGSDSMALLDALRQLAANLPLGILPVHINHNLRKTSKVDERVVADYCAKHQLDLKVVQVDVRSKLGAKGGGIEEKARELRYKALRQAAKTLKAKFIITAHTADDQVETIVANFLRGSSVRGMGGMRKVSEDILRPLLAVPKATLVQYVRSHRIKFAEDETNASLEFTRNKIRHQLLPAMRQFNSQFDATLLGNASLFVAVDNLIKEVAEKRLQSVGKIGNGSVQLSVGGLLACDELMRSEILRLAINKVMGSLEGVKRVHLAELNKMVAASQPRGRKQLIGKLLAVRAYDKITISRL